MLRTIEARIKMQIWLQDFTEKRHTSRHYMWRLLQIVLQL